MTRLEASSALFKWPPLAGIIQSMPDNDAEFASGPCLLQATVRMLTFGGFCNKPLRLLGTWEGIKVIHYMHGEIATQITDRQAISLTKKSAGGWRWGHVVKIIECTELVCFRNSVQHSESLSLSAGLFCYSRPLHSHVCVRTLFEFGSGGASCLQIIRAAPVFWKGFVMNLTPVQLWKRVYGAVGHLPSLVRANCCSCLLVASS